MDNAQFINSSERLLCPGLRQYSVGLGQWEGMEKCVEGKCCLNT